MAHRIAVDHRTDIYSLGATLYEVLAWRPPSRGKDHRDALSQISFRDPAPLRRANARIPAALETIIRKCLGKDPRDRYSTAEALVQDLCRLVCANPIEARPLSGWEKLGRLARRKRALIGATLVALLLAVTTALLLKHPHETEVAARTAAYERNVLEGAMLLEYAQARLPRKQEDPRAKIPAGDARSGTGFALGSEETPRPDTVENAFDATAGLPARVLPLRGHDRPPPGAREDIAPEAPPVVSDERNPRSSGRLASSQAFSE